MKRSRSFLLGALALLALASGATLADGPLSPSATPKAVDCCCVRVDGELVCTISGEVLEQCCCE